MRRVDVCGWFEVDVPGLPSSGGGVDYGFRLNGSHDVLPDPRSPFQPNGPHGMSRSVNHAAFKWNDHGWRPPPLSSGLIYELHVGTFTREGTFDSAIDKLDHLVSLGVTHVEIMPVAEFPGVRGWGYDGVSLFGPHHAYGGPDGLKRLVDAAHQRGLAMILDVVYNHLGPSGNYLPLFGPYFHQDRKTPWGDAINFAGADSDEVRRFFLDNALIWLRDYHFDGLRLDAVHAYDDNSAIHILEEMSEEVDRLEAQLGRDLVLIAESDLNDPRIITPREAGGYGLDAQRVDDFRHALHVALTGETAGFLADFTNLEHLARSLREAYVYAGVHCPGRRRRHGRRCVGVPAHRFVSFLQNHDQVGNRLHGERITHLISHDRAKIGSAILLLAPFVPMLWMGEEWAASTPFVFFTDHDEELGKIVAEGRRREFAAHGWPADAVPDPQDPRLFEQSKLKWDELVMPDHRAMLDWHRRLIALRRSEPDLNDPRLDAGETRFDEHERWLTFTRGRITVAVNFASEPRVVPVSGQVILASRDGIQCDCGRVNLPGETVAIFRT
jgi:maltooligosyltrehalose trehalohydrolase